MTINKHKDLHLDNEQEIRTSSKNNEESHYDLELDLVRATPYTRLKACDHYILRSLIG
jgi:hypothetical protein